jgi:hypothetical protein
MAPPKRTRSEKSPPASSKKERRKTYHWPDEYRRDLLEWWKLPENQEKVRVKEGDKAWSERCKREIFQDKEEIDTERIISKKDNMLRLFKDVRAQENTTGAGRDEGDATVEETLLKRFKWYREMEEVIEEKPNAGPPTQALDTLDPRLMEQNQDKICESAKKKGKMPVQTAGREDDEEEEEKEEEEEEEEEEGAEDEQQPSERRRQRVMEFDENHEMYKEGEEDIPPAESSAAAEQRAEKRREEKKREEKNGRSAGEILKSWLVRFRKKEKTLRGIQFG